MTPSLATLIALSALVRRCGAHRAAPGVLVIDRPAAGAERAQATFTGALLSDVLTHRHDAAPCTHRDRCPTVSLTTGAGHSADIARRTSRSPPSGRHPTNNEVTITRCHVVTARPTATTCSGVDVPLRVRRRCHRNGARPDSAVDLHVRAGAAPGEEQARRSTQLVRGARQSRVHLTAHRRRHVLRQGPRRQRDSSDRIDLGGPPRFCGFVMAMRPKSVPPCVARRCCDSRGAVLHGQTE